jgi:hypothetical protein
MVGYNYRITRRASHEKQQQPSHKMVKERKIN